MKRPMRCCSLLAALILAGCSAPQAPVELPTKVGDSEARTAPERAERLAERLERARIEAKIPGMAVAVVSRDEVLFARGFGVADLERGTAVDLDTQFAIGSCTKAFTAAVVGMLCDEGQMDWNAPVSRYLPELEMPGVSLLDLATHRSGRARMMDLMLLGMAPVDEGELFARVSAAKPRYEPGTQLDYLNVGYIALGEASARVSDMPWAQLVQTRVFDPLGMHDTRAEPPRPDDRLAQGYLWHPEQGQHLSRPTHGRDAGAGAIRSTANDMARWLQFQLSQGALETLADNGAPVAKLGEGRAYGLGWIIDEGGWEGQRVVEHRGNTDGFSAVVAMLPERGIGVVMMMNLAHGTHASFPGPELVWEAFVPGEHPATVTDEDYEAVVGAYRGPVPGRPELRFEFFVRDDQLLGKVDIEGVPAAVVEAPDAQGRRPLGGVPGTSVSFVRDSAGTVTAFVLHQGDFSFEIPREGFSLPVEVTEADVAPYLGSYRSADGTTVEVQIHRGRLAIAWGESPMGLPAGIYELHLPDTESQWRYRSNPDFGATFGPHTVVLEGAGHTLHLSKQGSDAPAIRTEELARLRQGFHAALDHAGAIQIRRTLHYPYAGLSGEGTLHVDATHTTERWNFVDFGRGEHTFDGRTHQEHTSLGQFEGLQARFIAAARAEQPLVQYANWWARFDTVQITGQVRDTGRVMAIVRLTRSNGPELSAHVDLETGDVRRLQQRLPMPELGTEVDVVTTFSDFRPIGDLRIPHALETTVGDGFNLMTETVTEVRLGDGS